MKILHLTAFYHPHLGGVETHVRQLATQLQKRGHQNIILTQRHQHSLPQQEVVAGMKVLRLDTTPIYFTKLNYKLTLWRQIVRNSRLFMEADIIHTHDVYWWMLPVLPLFWSKIFLTFHGWEGQYPVPWKNKLARWLWSKLAMKTIHVGDWIREFYWDKPDLVTYGGVVLSKEKPRARLHMTTKIVFIGRLEKENDLEKYLLLAQKIKKQSSVEIIWAGDGSYKKACQKLGQVTGMVDNLDSFTSSADIVWSASYLSILQAQALGKIVCAFYSHPLKQRYLETFPGSKLMLVETNVEKMSQQILSLLSKPAISKKYSQKTAQWANQQTWSKVADVYEKLWGLK